ncbi:MAG: hypothetical protein MI919_00170, partial [Holophagales bacterium]|nr:hypothetical protein [Holophagales bacterium]
MPHLSESLSRRSELLLLGLSLLVFSICGYYVYVGIHLPKRSIPWNSGSWIVERDQEGCDDSDRCLRIGDQVVSIDGVTLELFRQDRSRAILVGDGPAELVV